MMAKSSELDILVNALQFKPTEEQVEVKTAFWSSSRLVEDSTLVPSSVNLALAYQITGDERLEVWWKEPGFKSWFQNKDEFRQRIEALLFVGLNSIRDIFTDPDAAPAAKVKAFEVLSKLADKEPTRYKEIKYLDKKIQEMNPAELKKFIQSKQTALIEREKDDEEEIAEDSEDSRQND